jgi:type II secretory pathway component PulM
MGIGFALLILVMLYLALVTPLGEMLMMISLGGY